MKFSDVTLNYQTEQKEKQMYKLLIEIAHNTLNSLEVLLAMIKK